MTGIIIRLNLNRKILWRYDYDENQKSKYLLYLYAKVLHRRAMSRTLPTTTTIKING